MVAVAASVATRLKEVSKASNRRIKQQVRVTARLTAQKRHDDLGREVMTRQTKQSLTLKMTIEKIDKNEFQVGRGGNEKGAVVLGSIYITMQVTLCPKYLFCHELF